MSYLEEYRNEIFKKYSDGELIDDIKNYRNGTGRLLKVLNHFFEECIFNCRGCRGKLTPMQAMMDDDVMAKIHEVMSRSPNLYYSEDDVVNVKKFFSMAGRTAQRVANFCPKNARNIYTRYHEDGIKGLNILDTSCGFGSRMLATLLNGGNYYGFDPNHELMVKLVEYKNWLYENHLIEFNQVCALHECGSEALDREMVGKMDLSFTSPPYFNLETYSNDSFASSKNYGNYDLWIKQFAVPTVINTYVYLKKGGYAMINIKNLTTGKKQPLFDDFFNIFKSINGFEFVETFEMKHQHKRTFKGKDFSNGDGDFEEFVEYRYIKSFYDEVSVPTTKFRLIPVSDILSVKSRDGMEVWSDLDHTLNGEI